MVNELLHISVQVEAVRFKGNGTIFKGYIVEDDSSLTGEEIIVRCPRNILHPREEVFRGEIWALSGHKENFRGLQQFGATGAFLKRPIGENIIAAIAFNPKFAGIGEKKVRDLWSAFGNSLYDMLDANPPDILAFQPTLTPEIAERLLYIWKAEYSGELYRWLDKYRIPKALSLRLQEHYGQEARIKIEEDPYRLLAFGQSWIKVDSLAQHLGIENNDPRRLHAAVAEVLYQNFGKGHTAISTEELTKRVAVLLRDSNTTKGHVLACNALRNTYADGAFVRTGDLWQATGVYLMEAFVADRFNKMIEASKSPQQLLNDSIVKQTIHRYEEMEHQLSNEQKTAVGLALKNHLCVITGGAGVGKTSVLRCIYIAIEATQGNILQMALSGRAAKRMEDATGCPARTIAGFLTNTKLEELDKITHVVIDEASMLDIVSAFQILRKLPESVKLILVGDPYQLPPIGAGLTFHIVAKPNSIHTVHLTKIYRQTGESGIPAISNAIRIGKWPHISEYQHRDIGVFCLPAESNNTTDLLLQIYEELGGDSEPEEVQILSATKADNPYGVVGINKSFHTRYTEGEPLVLVSAPSGDIKDSGFRQGDRIMVTRNQWERQLFNGSLGFITKAFEIPVRIDGNRFAVAQAVIDGKEIMLSQDDLEWIIHSYSISIHKSQGSQFKRVIIPICKSRLLDRALIYTAITRGVDQVILLGDLSSAKAAVEAPPQAWLRQVGLSSMIHSMH